MSLTKVSYSMIQGASVNLLDYGAVGNGTTNDYTAITAALTAAVGGALYVPAGYTFASATRIQVPSNVRIYGGGTLKALPLGTSASIEGFLYGASLSDIAIDNITIDCNPSAQTHPLLTAVYFTGSTRIKITNSRVTCSYAGVYVRSSSNYVEVSDNYIDNSYGLSTDAALRHGPSIIVGASNSSVSSNTVKGIASTAVADSDIATGIVLGADGTTVYTNLVLSDNIVESSYSAYALTYITNSAVTGNTAINCLTKNHSQGLIATNCNAITVDGNTFRDIDYTGIAFVNCQDSSISNNVISNSSTFLIGAQSNGGLTANGITVSQTGSGLSKDNIISANHIGVNGVTSGIAYKALLVYGDRNSVIGNLVKATTSGITSYGLQFTGAKCIISDNVFDATYTILDVFDVGGWTTCQNNIFENNLLTSTGTFAIIDASTGPNRYFLNSIISGATSYTNSHYIFNGDLEKVIVNKAADYTIQVQDSTKLFTNGGATGTVVLTLPSAVGTSGYTPYGLTFDFSKTNGNTLRIEPNGTDIIGGGNAGKYMQIGTSSSVKLTCVSSGIWVIESLNGTVTYEP